MKKEGKAYVEMDVAKAHWDAAMGVEEMSLCFVGQKDHGVYGTRNIFPL